MESAQPLVSIIITCYNYENYVGQAITSALSQGYDNLEIIVIDDGSQDQSWDAILPFGDRVKAFRTDNRGSISACLEGFAASSGDYVLFLDADDMLDAKALATISPFFDGNTSKVQFCMQPIDAQGRFILTPFPRFDERSTSEALIESINSHGAYMTPPTSGNAYRRDIYERVGNVSYDVGIDGVSYLFAPFVGEVVSIDAVLGYYRIHDRNRSSINKISAARLEIEKKTFLARLHHLQELISQSGITANMFSPKLQYLYSTEREVYSKVLSGQPLSWELRADYLSLVNKETSGFSRIIHLIYSLSVILLPRTIAWHVVSFRIDSSRSSSVRNFLKKNLRPYRGSRKALSGAATLESRH